MKNLIETAEQYIKDNPRCTVAGLAESLSISRHRARTLASQLEVGGRIHKTHVPGSTLSYLTHGPKPKGALVIAHPTDMPKQVVVSHWPKPTIAPQSWLSALEWKP